MGVGEKCARHRVARCNKKVFASQQNKTPRIAFGLLQKIWQAFCLIVIEKVSNEEVSVYSGVDDNVCHCG
jgi:hypothetical protein